MVLAEDKPVIIEFNDGKYADSRWAVAKGAYKDTTKGADGGKNGFKIGLIQRVFIGRIKMR